MKLMSHEHATQADSMTEKQPHHANGAPETLQDWPTLVGRAVDDVTRILQSEARMLETSIGAALETRIASAIATLTVVAVMICGGVCILCAGILLLHQWLPLWQSFGVAGIAIMIVGIASYAIKKTAVGISSA
jgi:VIT1/CCC1 family predicted Fe2+/Mn2+ transporter